MAFDEEPQHDHEWSAAVDAWVVAFDRGMNERGDFPAIVAAMAENGCFDVRAVAERWILANPSDAVTVARPQAAPPEPAPLEPALEEEPVLEEARGPRALCDDLTSQMPVVTSSTDIAHFHSLLDGGIERGQIYEAFPAFRLVIDEAVVQYESDAPILSEAQTGPSREDLDDEIRRTRQELVESGKRPRRRWRSRD